MALSRLPRVSRPLPLRSAVTTRQAGEEVKAEPGFLEGDLVGHREPPLKGEFAKTVSLTDGQTG